MDTRILIKNKLEIQPGNVIKVPGCEPTSSLTSDTLSRNLKCNASVIPVEDVLELIPGSKVVRVLSPFGQSGTGMFIEFPSGPPSDGNLCPADCLTDWYAVLRKNARNLEQEEEEPAQCAGFNFSGCQFDFDPLAHTRDPEQRPNEKPLRNGAFGNRPEIRPSELKHHHHHGDKK